MAQQFKGSVHVENLDVLVKAFGRVDKNLKRQLQARLRGIGKIVADEAKGIAEFHRLRGEEDYDRHRGSLITQIRPSVRGSSVFIRDSARTKSAAYPAGYNYPARFEFESKGAKAFMRPALQGRRGDIVREFEKLEDWIASEWGR